MSEENVAVQDNTDLTTRLGPDKKYQKLVAACFKDDEVGNLTWEAAKALTYVEFLDTYTKNKPNRLGPLKLWVDHYGLENRFKQPPPTASQPDKEPTRNSSWWGKVDQELQEGKEKFISSFQAHVVDKGRLADAFDWDSSAESSRWATQLLKLYKIAKSETDTDEKEEGTVTDDKVFAVGENILSLGMTNGIDRDSQTVCPSKAIFLRQEQLKVADLAANAAFSDTPIVAVPGSPGAGKTFGTMAAIVAEILSRGYPVYRITSKDGAKLDFLLPSLDGLSVQAWRAEFPADGLWNKSRFSSMKSVVTVIDPPEAPDKVDQQSLTGRSIKLPSDNKSKHYNNLDKNNAVIYTNPPTAAEALVICRCIVTEKDGKIVSTFKGNNDLDCLDDEIRRRILLVGPYPRYVVNYTAFSVRFNEVIAAVDELGLKINDVTLSTLNIEKQLKLGSGKLQSTYANGETADERKMRDFKLHPLAMYSIAKKYSRRMDDFVDAKGSAELGWFFEQHVCQRLLAKGFSPKGKKLIFPDWCESGRTYLQVSKKRASTYEYKEASLSFSKEKTHESGYKAISELKTDGKKVLVLPTSNFPFIDFALGQTWFVNAKVGTLPYFKCSTALKFLERINLVERDQNQWKTCAGKEKDRVELDLIGIDNLENKCVFEGSQDEYKLLKKHLVVTNIDTGTKEAGNALFRLIEEALQAYRKSRTASATTS